MKTTNLQRQIKEFCKKLTLKELLEVEEIILQVVKERVKTTEKSDWKNDFLKISTWSHLDKNNEVKISSWKISAF